MVHALIVVEMLLWHFLMSVVFLLHFACTISDINHIICICVSALTACTISLHYESKPGIRTISMLYDSALLIRTMILHYYPALLVRTMSLHY